MFQLKKADRTRVKLKIGMWGPSGSGKTYSALVFAKGLVGDWNKIAVIDTENQSADLYSHLGDYYTCTMGSPYSPERNIEAMNAVLQNKNIECIIIDSISHEWDAKGGCLDIHNKMGGRFNDWSKVTPLHTSLIDNIVRCPIHTIVTARSKVDYSVDKDSKGKTVITKQGLKTVTKEGLDYEMTLAFQISHHGHHATVDKDRTSLFNQIPFLITEETGALVREWNSKGLNKTVLDAKGIICRIDTSEKYQLFLEWWDRKRDEGMLTSDECEVIKKYVHEKIKEEYKS